MNIPLNIISLGAGVQSSTMALMAARGELTPMPDAAIFADTQNEPQAVYEWLDYLEKELPFPVYRVTAGDLGEMELRIRTSKKSGKRYLKNSIPAFVEKENGKRGMLGRKCTTDFKVVPIQRKVKELIGIKRSTKDVRAIMWIGISWDESHRMKASRMSCVENVWPIVEKRMTREDCLLWMQEHGYPKPPRSACTFCPMHSDVEWERLRTDSPDEFAKVVSFESRLIEAAGKQEALVGTPYLHESCIPIGEVVFTSNSRAGQLDMFGEECEGLCGT